MLMGRKGDERAKKKKKNLPAWANTIILVDLSWDLRSALFSSGE
jgi:hypothetical protein